MQARTIDIMALPKQIEFLKANEREVLYSGAFGAGKSRAVCLKLVMRAAVPGAREGLCRKHLVTLKATTLKTLLERDGKLAPVLPQGTYTHNKSDKVIRIQGGGEIQYFGLDEPDKIGSYNLTGCGVDEAIELAEGDWRQIRGRCRVVVDGLSNQVYGACNPGPPSHFLAERFGLAEGHKSKPNCRPIQTASADNHFLPPDYLADLDTFTGLAKSRYVEGKWVGSEGMVYDRWDRLTFVQEREGPWQRIIVGQDEGYTNPAVLLVVGEDSDGRLHVIREWYKPRQLETAVIEEAKRLNDDYAPEAFVVDPSAAKLRARMESENLYVVPAENDVFAGIQAVQRRLVVAGDGDPRLTVDPSCENLIREFETYEWKTGKDQPRKENDHAADALRYIVAYVDGLNANGGLEFRILGERHDARQPALVNERSDIGWTSFDSFGDRGWRGG